MNDREKPPVYRCAICGHQVVGATTIADNGDLLHPGCDEQNGIHYDVLVTRAYCVTVFARSVDEAESLARNIPDEGLVETPRNERAISASARSVVVDS